MINVKRLQNVYFTADDVPSTASFYEQVFGLKKKFSDGDRWTQFDIAGSNFAIGAHEEGVHEQTGAVPVFEVDDIDGLEQLVHEHGGTVIAHRDMGDHGLVTTLQDPAGNSIQLFSRKGS